MRKTLTAYVSLAMSVGYPKLKTQIQNKHYLHFSADRIITKMLLSDTFYIRCLSFGIPNFLVLLSLCASQNHV
jgi:hypothetical protein